MNLLPLLFLLVATPPEGGLTAPPPRDVLVYEGPVEELADPAAYEFTIYAKGELPFVAVDEANLRGGASIDAPVLRTLPLGLQVEVLEVASESVRVLDRVDRWYRVRAPGAEPKEGFVLGNVLTPLAATSDLDGDGKEERLAVSFTSNFVAHVRVLEPELSARRRRAVAELDFLLPEAEAGRRGGRARLVKVSAVDQGVALSTRSFGLELCASSCVVHAVAYEARKGALGSIAVPSDVRGDLRLFSRPRKLLSLTMESEARGPDEYVPCNLVAQVRSGPHQDSDILSCVVSQPGKSQPDALFATYYLREGGKRLRRLAHGASGYYMDELDSKLRRKGYQVVVDPDTLISGLQEPEVLYADARGQIRLQRRTPSHYVRSAVQVAFVHPTLGTVTMTRPAKADTLEEGHPLATNGFFVPQPDGGFLFYAYQRDLSARELSWKEERFEGISYTLEQNPGCEPVKSVDLAPADVRASDLVEVGEVKGAGPLFALKRGTHPEVERAWEEWNALPDYRPDEAKRFASKDVFFASAPRLYWRDSFGRLLRLRRADLKPPCMAEPIVYFYPEQRSRVRYTLAPSVRVARAEPLPRDNAWSFLATPQGILTQVEATPEDARRTFSHLFWEGTSAHFPPPAEGVCVPGPRTGEFFREVLPRLGLLTHETEDFVAAWVPRMEGAAFHVIGFHPREVLDALAPVEVSPPPASMIRLLMDATPVEECPALTAPSLPDVAPSREGFTVVEWGGVLREGR